MDGAEVGNRALTVYGPEVLVSGLTAALDEFLGERAGVSLAKRFMVLHDADSITQFYGLTGSTSGAHWPLVVDLFDGRPCMASIWTGPNALERIQRLKGATQPVKATPETVRGNFACDNPVCNLIHVSDSSELAVKEIEILQGRALASAATESEATGRENQNPSPRHSSLWTFVTALCRMDLTIEVRVPVDGFAPADTAATDAILSLHAIATERPRLRDPIIAFLDGRHSDLLSTLPAGFRMTAWERLLIECGCHSTPLWIEKLRGLDRIGVPRCP